MDFFEENSRERELYESMKDENESLVLSSPNYETYIGAKITNRDIFYLEVKFEGNT